MNFPVFDLHCDTALELLGKDLRSPKSLKKNNLLVVKNGKNGIIISGSIEIPKIMILLIMA